MNWIDTISVWDKCDFVAWSPLFVYRLCIYPKPFAYACAYDCKCLCVFVCADVVAD